MGYWKDDGTWVREANETVTSKYCQQVPPPQNIRCHTKACNWNNQIAEIDRKQKDREQAMLQEAITESRHQKLTHNVKQAGSIINGTIHPWTIPLATNECINLDPENTVALKLAQEPLVQGHKPQVQAQEPLWAQALEQDHNTSLDEVETEMHGLYLEDSE